MPRLDRSNPDKQVVSTDDDDDDDDDNDDDDDDDDGDGDDVLKARTKCLR